MFYLLLHKNLHCRWCPLALKVEKYLLAAPFTKESLLTVSVNLHFQVLPWDSVEPESLEGLPVPPLIRYAPPQPSGPLMDLTPLNL